MVRRVALDCEGSAPVRTCIGCRRRAPASEVLRFVAGWTEPEIAAAMGVSRGTVATTLHRARQQLNARLTETMEAQP